MTILELIKRREKTKREHVHLGVEIFEKRYQARDYNGHLLAEFTNSAVKSSRYASNLLNKIHKEAVDQSIDTTFSLSRPAFAPLYGNQYSSQHSNQAWTNSGAQYHSLAGNNATSGLTQAALKRGGGDIDAAILNASSRKEKRQYKKRKHKTQRDKPPYTAPGKYSINQKIFRFFFGKSNVCDRNICRSSS